MTRVLFFLPPFYKFICVYFLPGGGFGLEMSMEYGTCNGLQGSLWCDAWRLDCSEQAVIFLNGTGHEPGQVRLEEGGQNESWGLTASSGLGL